jgi:hypothetical protein
MEGGSIHLGMCAQMFARVTANQKAIESLFSVSLVHRTLASNENYLVRGSNTIADELCESEKLGPKDAGPEDNFMISLQTVSQNIGVSVSVKHGEVKEHLAVLVGSNGEKPEDCSFIRLTKLSKSTGMKQSCSPWQDAIEMIAKCTEEHKVEHSTSKTRWSMWN